MKRIALILFLFCGGVKLYGQELNCNISINIEQTATQEVQIFEEMENTIRDFMNDTRWTEDQFEPEERIECDISITILKVTTNNRVFEAQAQVQSNRPVYGTDYESLMFRFIDNDFTFTYDQGTRLNFTENVFNGDLSAFLAFYAFIILGYDYDSFSEMGGSPYFEKAQNIVLSAPGNASPGWRERQGQGLKNRFALSDQLNSPNFEPFRKGLYTYHRKALDNLPKEPVEGQEMIMEVLDQIEEVKQTVTTSIVFQSFFLAKHRELIKIFGGAEREIKMQALEKLTKLDPTNGDKYQEIVNPRR